MKTAKIVLKTNYVSEEFWDGTAFALIELDPGEAQKILEFREKSTEFMATLTDCPARLRVDFPGAMAVFDDDDETIAAIQSVRDANEGFVRVPDDFEIPDRCEKARIELESINIHHNGDLWLEATSKHSGDYLEIELPLEVVELAAKP
jgi:hypothetical protein